MANVKIPPMRSEVAEVMKLLRGLSTEQQLGVLEITEGIKVIAEKSNESIVAFILNFLYGLVKKLHEVGSHIFR